MNAIKNFFHAFGDIIFGLAIVAAAVFIIGFQITDDFNIVVLAQNSYDKVYEMVNGTGKDESADILLDPEDVVPSVDTEENPGDVATGTELDPIAEGPEGEVSPPVEGEAPTGETPAGEGEDSTVAVPDVLAIRTITISPGSTADEVVTGLFANGIIGSKEEFLAEYARLPVGRFIQSGTFKIPTGSTSAEILAIIAP